MEKIKLIGAEYFNLVPDQEEVFGWLKCTPNLPCRTVYEAVWDETVDLLQKSIRTSVVILYERDKWLDVVLSLGPDAEVEASKQFKKGKCIQGSLMNVLCDELLFQLDKQVAALLELELAKEGLFLGQQLEPGIGFGKEEQRKALEQMRALLPFLSLSCHGVLSPAKSMMYRVMLSRTHCAHSALHDCSQCSQKDCLYRTPGV